ncbi:16913_t:CDS:2 [Rhizophagus irregularis]|nr:16913_t:CDS:2 [Rhizophagus irregularis]
MNADRSSIASLALFSLSAMIIFLKGKEWSGESKGRGRKKRDDKGEGQRKKRSKHSHSERIQRISCGWALTRLTVLPAFSRRNHSISIRRLLSMHSTTSEIKDCSFFLVSFAEASKLPV